MAADLIALFLLTGSLSAVTTATVVYVAQAGEAHSIRRGEALRVVNQTIRQDLSFSLPTLSALPPWPSRCRTHSGTVPCVASS